MRSQIAHIFRKDVRRHWREIALAVAILVAFAWVEPKQWFRQDVRQYIDYRFLTGLLTALVPIGWAFLIVRLVHEENLVGDRQFWVTRPYEWKKLLAEKLLFIVIFVNIPLLIADVVLLKRAGFAPTSYLSGLLSLQLLWILIFILPSLTLGTITLSIGQAVLVVLGTILFFVALGILRSPNPYFYLPAESISDSLELMLLAATTVTAVMWQYARRRTVQSRFLVMGAIVATVFIIPLAIPHGRLVAKAYPRGGAEAGGSVHLAFDSEKQGRQLVGYPEKNKVNVGIPLIVSGMSPDSLISVAGIAVTVEAPTEHQRSPGWGSSYLFPNDQHTQTDFTIDKDFFERVKTTPVSLHVSFALAEFREKDVRRIMATTTQFAVPGEGQCSVTDIGDGVCLFALKTPWLLVSARSDEITCPPRGKAPQLPSGITGYGYVGYRNSGLANFGLSPVQVVPLGVWDWGEPDDPARPGICPGTPLSFGILEKAQDMGRELQIDGIRLAEYELKGPAAESIGTGTAVGIGGH